MSKIIKVGGSHMVSLSPGVMAEANLGTHDKVVTVPVQDGVLVKAKASISGAIHQALQDDMDLRPNVYRRLAE